MPLALVVAVFAPPANVPLAPVCGGAVNVTNTPLTGFELLSTTIACSGLVNCLRTVALCGVPPVALIAAGAAALFVSLKLAVDVVPAVEAVTV